MTRPSQPGVRGRISKRASRYRIVLELTALASAVAVAVEEDPA